MENIQFKENSESTEVHPTRRPFSFFRCFCKFPSKVVSDTQTDLSSFSKIQFTNKSRLGMTGLQNMGNSCFLNSALQALSHNMTLTQYFLSNEFQQEINNTNPLGTQGNLAFAYCEVLQHLWRGSSNSYTPSKLKKLIAKIAPQFIGFQQHDSHELLCYLLDGLHEDLNRVIEKPYSQDPDQTVTDSDTKSAQLMWEKYLSRNSSIIVDLFHGQYKSTIFCPKCQNYSYAYDPFNSLSLPIPTVDQAIKVVYFIFADPKKLPVSMIARAQTDSTLSDIRKFIVKQLGVKSDRFIFAGVSNNNIKQLFLDSASVASVQNIILFAYQSDSSLNQKDFFQVQVYKNQNRDRLIAYPRVVFIQTSKTFQDLHQEIFNKFKLYLPRSKQSFAKFQESPYYTLEYQGGRRVPCVECESTECRGCEVPFNRQGLQRILNHDRLITIQLAFTKINEVTFSEINKCVDHTNNSRSTKKQREPVSLSDCFRLFSAPETLKNENSWYCKSCKQEVQATKKLEIFKAPLYLIIHLKRFKSHGFLREKITRPVIFQGKGLDISEFVIGDQKPGVYDILAVTNHFGTLSGGHYTATCYNSARRMWLEFNDSHVSQASELSSSSSYMLFYKRRTIN